MTMVPLFMALLLAPPGNGSIGENRIILRDPIQGAMPVTDKDLIPARLPDCQTQEQEQRVRLEQIRGESEECLIRRQHRDEPR
jgi:hypothetical protein